MKRLTIVILILIVKITISPLSACDQCGCSVAGSYNNVTAYAHNNYMMFKAGYYKFSTGTATSKLHSEMFSVDAIVGYNITNRLHILAFVPYRLNQFSGEDNTYTVNGFGDMGLLGNYVVATNRDNMMAKYTYSLTVKAGVELPTGKFIDDYRALGVPANLSAGSKTFDGITGLRYIYKRKSTTLIGDFTFKYNPENEANYRFGNQHTATILAAQRFMQSKTVLTPYVGVTGELDGTDLYHEIEQHGTSGETVLLNSGIELGFGDYIAGITADFPLYGNFGEEAKSSPRFSLRFAYMLND
ncbi:MAG: hypothetical protein WBP31_04695 [Chitinophagales bacterium]